MASYEMIMPIDSLGLELIRDKYTYNNSLIIKEMIPLVADNDEFIFDGYIQPFKKNWYQDDDNPTDKNELSLVKEVKNWDMVIVSGAGSDDRPRRSPLETSWINRRF